MSKLKRTNREQTSLGDALFGTCLDEVRRKAESTTEATTAAPAVALAPFAQLPV